MENDEKPIDLTDVQKAWISYMNAKAAFTEKHSTIAPDRNEAGGAVYAATKALEATLVGFFSCRT